MKAWMTSSGICWPAEWLHSEPGLKRAHIFTVKYDSSLMKTDDADQSRKFGDFLKNVKGIFYFSTPHHGVDNAGGCEFDGELAEYAKLSNAKIAQMNGKFEKIRRARNWRTGGLGHLSERSKGRLQQESIRLPEATMRHDTDSFTMMAETWEAINKPNSRESSSFQIFVNCVRSFIEDHVEEDSNEEYEEFIRTKVGLESRVDEVVSLFSSLEKAEGNVSAVVLHGMGGIGKSTLGDAMFLKLRKKFHRDCQYRKIIRKTLKKCYKDAYRPLLIFIDNIENADDLDDIFPDGEINLPLGSYILIASRNLAMYSKLRALKVRKVRYYAVQELDGYSAQRLFLKNAVKESNEIQSGVQWRDVQKVLNACKGLPLALKVIGAAVAEVPYSDWDDILEQLKNCLSLDGTKEDNLWGSLEFSYNLLDKGLQRVFLDIVFCFNGSPWNELKVLYGPSLWKLEQKALISKNKRLEYAPSLRFPTVKVHALFVVLGEKVGKDLGSHLKLNVQQDYDSGLGRGFSCLREDFLVSYEGRCDVFVLDGNLSYSFYPDIILESLECFICSNSNVPFRDGDFTGLKKLRHLEITTAVDTNRSYKFPHGMRKVRVENKYAKNMMFGGGFDSPNRLEEYGLMSVGTSSLLSSIPVSQLTSLKKVILRNISRLDNNLPEALFQMDSLQSVSIQYCEHIDALPDVDMGSLEHLHLALPTLIRLPEYSLKTLRSLRTQMMKNSESNVLELQLPKHGAREWHYYTRDELDSVLVEDTLTATSMPPLINRWHYYTRDELDSTLVEDTLAATSMPPLINRNLKDELRVHLFIANDMYYKFIAASTVIT
ncbi:hypothetical protein R1sor_014793 [Riccia sorocarpa]|uniref:NB-ARC domain-containing protein n=1 Tax=Riccia sorocarpa TaxID=122646 RepID=A0ABD3HD93_9MARC